MRQTLKKTLNVLCLVLVSPFAVTSWLEKNISKHSETVFLFWSHVFSLLPGLPGVFLRRAYYFLTLDNCSLNCYISFGSIFTHRASVIEDHVYLGAYAIVGSAFIGKNSLIGSRVSILSGKALHIRSDDGGWEPFDASRMVQVKLGPKVWVGEGALIMADLGEGSMVGAGAVVTSKVRSNIVVAGNPARFIRKIEETINQQTPTNK
jgi:virginiamycin A acetyltransferase